MTYSCSASDEDSPLCKDYKYKKRDLQNLRAEAGLLREQRDRLSGAVNALMKNRED